ncbi:spike base protein, RCAP_Rcc01079 family [Phaeovulum sp.]|uniref:spike base protein, RCAP_Rcc01079 family n=1 Tax=Phaeovulum sp. TaxID=2934796 RepID=UPI0039E4950D
MSNPFKSRAPSLNGPATDIVPVIPNDATDLATTAIALFIETAGALRIVTVGGQERVVNVDDFFLLPVGVTRVKQTGTTASGIHAMVLA